MEEFSHAAKYVQVAHLLPCLFCQAKDFLSLMRHSCITFSALQNVTKSVSFLHDCVTHILRSKVLWHKFYHPLRIRCHEKTCIYLEIENLKVSIIHMNITTPKACIYA